jgi:hypothetical protein
VERILVVSGSRTYDDFDFILNVLCTVPAPGFQPVLFHGRCPPRDREGQVVGWKTAESYPLERQLELCGADWLCDVAARFAGGWTIERRPADWSAGLGGGFARNDSMVREAAARAGRTGWIRCIALMDPCVKPQHCRWEPHPSHGAEHCADCAEDAGILTYRLVSAKLKNLLEKG